MRLSLRALSLSPQTIVNESDSLGHSSPKTTTIYMHAMNKPKICVISPLDQLARE